ncbi:polymerase [Histoplasma capsulatum var. duboisii H88]|uniref:Polymerase n=1 Tax=Ajellomyces capsulatus (strain H88) TaxID=544711 RepID=A0A8A1LQ86_AJEC8|nr:polymerase [Histoplasma capsulatum var. duboisii H88]
MIPLPMPAWMMITINLPQVPMTLKAKNRRPSRRPNALSRQTMTKILPRPSRRVSPRRKSKRMPRRRLLQH